jgi:S1-C subfamily serine protease
VDLNPFDLGALVLVVVAVYLGFRSGALPQVLGLVGAAVGGVLGVLALPAVEPILEGLDLDPTLSALLVLVGLLMAVGVGEGLGSALGQTAARGLGTTVFSTIDRVGGAFVGAGQALLIVWLAGGLLAVGPMAGLSTAAQTSLAVRALDRVLPPPTAIAADLGRLLDDTALPDVFVGLEPLPAPPVDRPDNPAARAIAGDADESTVKVTARTCSNQSTGTGFVVADDYVVTNAHVIAGSTRTLVSREGLGSRDATPVFFDPDLDIAVLRVDDLDAPPLPLATTEPARGASAAALGYPGGSGLTIIPAAVAGRYDAVGRDIYGTDRVTRRILELRAEIERGDSGGPLVLENGTVGGVIFAEARSDPQVGYALSAPSVIRAIAPALVRTTAVDTGRCLR